MKKIFTSFILSFLFIGLPKLNAQCLADWSYQLPIDVYHNYSFDVYNYQVKLDINTAALIGSGHLDANGDDIRFSIDCCTTIPHTVVSGWNTANTEIWVKIPYLAAWYSTVIYMNYGNPSATNTDNPNAVFDLWEPFDNSVNHFTGNCGTGTYNVAAGAADISWSSTMMLESDVVFDMDTVYMAEMNVNAASGNWPGINFSKIAPDYKGYSMLYSTGQVRIGEAGLSASDFCRGENWASAQFPIGSPVGLWMITWPYTGLQVGSFPGMGTFSAASTTHNKDNDLKVCVGGISGGTGSMNVDWIRVRKYIPYEPIVTVYSEQLIGYQYVQLPDDTILCDINNFVIDAGAGFWDYAWSNATYNQTININTPGTYYVTTMDSNYCYSTDTMVVGEHPPISLMLMTGTTVCPGDTVTLDAGPGFITYDWTPGGNSQIQLALTAATYSITVTDANGCTATDSVIVNHYPQPLANFTTFMPVDLTINFNNTSISAASSYWDFGNGLTSYAPDTTVAYATPGSYTVCLTVTNASGCVDDTCRTIDVGYIGIENELDGVNVNIFPNPATDFCWIHTSQLLNEVKLSIMDVTGKLVKEIYFDSFLQQQIDLSGIAPGTYLIRINTPQRVNTSSLIVH